MESAHEAIADITASFYAAFTNVDGPAPVDVLYELCLPQALIVNATNETPTVYTLAEFVEPRRDLLSSGTLIAFQEREVSERTDLEGRIARRSSRYEKTWIEGETQNRGAGTKMFSFVVTPAGWKIASVIWCDTPVEERKP